MLEQAERPLFSFEFMPPRSTEEQERLWSAIEALAPLGPDFVSVTYGANGSNRDRTIRTTANIIARTNMQTMGHLTLVDQPVGQLVQTIADYRDAGVNHILALRGDPAEGPAAPWRAHPQGLDSAIDLVRLVREQGDFCVGVAAYTAERDPSRPGLEAEILVAKAEAGAQFAITQLFYDPDHYFDLVDKVRALGCQIPIIPGIMPVTNVGQIARFAELSGQAMPDYQANRLYQVADDPEQVRVVGARIATELATTLLRGGAPGLQFFTLNRSVATRRIFAMLLERHW